MRAYPGLYELRRLRGLVQWGDRGLVWLVRFLVFIAVASSMEVPS